MLWCPPPLELVSRKAERSNRSSYSHSTSESDEPLAAADVGSCIAVSVWRRAERSAPAKLPSMRQAVAPSQAAAPSSSALPPLPRDMWAAIAATALATGGLELG